MFAPIFRIHNQNNFKFGFSISISKRSFERTFYYFGSLIYDKRQLRSSRRTAFSTNCASQRSELCDIDGRLPKLRKEKEEKKKTNSPTSHHTNAIRTHCVCVKLTYDIHSECSEYFNEFQTRAESELYYIEFHSRKCQQNNRKGTFVRTTYMTISRSKSTTCHNESII